jgi:outer membrane receptor protein involved in Fe transport
VSGSIAVTEPFLELSVPLLSEKPFVNYLGLDLGYRYSDYNLAGGVDTYKVALQWRPVESFQVRASYNRAIRAPNISDLFLPKQENFPTYSDPCNFNSSYRTGADAAAVAALCTAQGIPASALPTYTQAFSQARAFVGGNVDLKPETADTYTLGVAWQSQSDNVWARNLSLSVDYYNYKIDDVISSLSVNSIIGRCFNSNGGNPTYSNSNLFCQLFTRDTTFRPDGVVTTNLNLASTKLEGVDTQVDWGIPLGENYGDLSFKLLWTHVLKRSDQETISDPFYDYQGTISQTIGSATPKDKAVLTTMWAWRELTLRYNLRYIDGMDVVNNDAKKSKPTIGVKPTVPTYVYHDLSARYDFNKTYSLTVGVNNVTDKQPPIYTTDSQAGIQSNTDPSTYDVLGRRYFLNFGAKF